MLTIEKTMCNAIVTVATAVVFVVNNAELLSNCCLPKRC